MKQLASDDETFLQLTGSENECVFSASTPEHKPTVNVSELVMMLRMSRAMFVHAEDIHKGGLLKLL